MGFKFKWKPSKTQKREFAKTMNEIDEFCEQNHITASKNNDSYYFTLHGTEYRVSNHSIEKSNSKAFDSEGNQIREKYHPDTRDKKVVYIHAGKTRLIEIYTNLKKGLKLDGRGNRVFEMER